MERWSLHLRGEGCGTLGLWLCILCMCIFMLDDTVHSAPCYTLCSVLHSVLVRVLSLWFCTRVFVLCQVDYFLGSCISACNRPYTPSEGTTNTYHIASYRIV